MSSGLHDIDLTLRRLVYDGVMSGGTIPTVSALAVATGTTQSNTAAALNRLSDAHMLVLQRDGEILMANPFSAVPTPFPVTIDGLSWYGNCVWDAMGIAAMLHQTALLEASCGCCGTAMKLRVPDDCADDDDRAVHFAIPAAHWWDDIVFN